MAVSSPPTPGRLRPSDLSRVALVGIRTRKLRAALSALGIAIGVAAIVAVLGLSASSESGLLAEINAARHEPADGHQRPDPLRPDCRAAPGRTGDDRPHRAGRATCRTPALSTANVFRSPLIPSIDTNALSVDAASLGLPGSRRDDGCPRAATSTPRPRPNRSACSGRPPRSASASTASIPVSGSGSTTCGSTSPGS